MHISRKPFFVYLLLFLLTGSGFGYSQNIFKLPAPYSEDKALILAEKFFHAGMYDDAITEYKRFIFFNQQADITGKVFSLLAYVYFKQGKWKETIICQNQAILRVKSEALKNEYTLTLCKYLLSLKRYSEAEVSLLKLFYFSNDELAKKKASFYLGISHIYRYNWQKAEQYFQYYFEGNSDYTDLQKQEVFNLLHSDKMKKYKSELLAIVLSIFIPGLGQIYGGDFPNGIVSLGINGGLGYAIYLNIISQDYSNAAMIFMYVFDRYYRGNLYNAGRLVREYNEALSRKIADSILTCLLGFKN